MNAAKNFGFLPPPLIQLKVEPRSYLDVDLPSAEGISDEAIERIRAALLNAGFNLIEVKNLGIGDEFNG